MASPTRWTSVWVNTGSWWWTGRPGVLQFMGSQSQTWLSDWTKLNWVLFGVHIYFKLSCLLDLISWSLYNVLLVIVFVLKSILFYKSIASPAFFSFPFARNTFSLCVSLYLKWLLQATYIGSCVCICLATVYLLIREIIPCVILDRFVHIAMLLIVCGLLCSTFLFPSAFVLFPCDLLTLFRVIFGFFYLLGVCVSIINFDLFT